MIESCDLRLRVAHAADAEDIARLHAESWRRHYRGAYSDAYLDGDVETDRRSVWTERLHNRDDRVTTLLAHSRGLLMGFIHVVFDEHPVWGTLVENLHVVRDRQRAGIGT